jgi:hypothetical protein
MKKKIKKMLFDFAVTFFGAIMLMLLLVISIWIIKHGVYFLILFVDSI